MKLYHFTDKKLKVIDPEYYLANSYTPRGKVKRSFHFTTPDPPEWRFKGCQYCYEVKVDIAILYDLREDKDGLTFKFRDIEKLLIHIKENYKGILYSQGSYDVVCLFYNISILREVKI